MTGTADYCNSLLAGISEQNLDSISIQRVQSKVARIVCNAGRRVPIYTTFPTLATCPSQN